MRFGKFGRSFNKTFSKGNINRFFNKSLPEGIIKTGDIAGTLAGSAGTGLAGLGYLTGQPELVMAGKGLGAVSAVAKGSSGLTKGIQAAKKY
jgi:Ca2+-dependent lipid-binding protein